MVARFKCETYNEKWTKAAQGVIREAVECLDECTIFVAVEELCGRIVGVIVFSRTTLEAPRSSRRRPQREREPPVRPALQVLSLGVVRDRRREHIGRDLKSAVMAEAVATRARYVVSEVHKRNWQMDRVNEALKVVKTKKPVHDEYHFTAVRVRARLRDRVRVGRRRWHLHDQPYCSSALSHAG